jgi:hypothetical protein
MDSAVLTSAENRLNDPDFIREVMDHYRAIDLTLAALTLKHTLPVVIAMFGKRSSGGLLACQVRQRCTREEALEIVRRIKAQLINLPRCSDE